MCYSNQLTDYSNGRFRTGPQEYNQQLHLRLIVSGHVFDQNHEKLRMIGGLDQVWNSIGVPTRKTVSPLI